MHFHVLGSLLPLFLSSLPLSIAAKPQFTLTDVYAYERDQKHIYEFGISSEGEGYGHCSLELIASDPLHKAMVCDPAFVWATIEQPDDRVLTNGFNVLLKSM